MYEPTLTLLLIHRRLWRVVVSSRCRWVSALGTRLLHLPLREISIHRSRQIPGFRAHEPVIVGRRMEIHVSPLAQPQVHTSDLYSRTACPKSNDPRHYSARWRVPLYNIARIVPRRLPDLDCVPSYRI